MAIIKKDIASAVPFEAENAVCRKDETYEYTVIPKKKPAIIPQR